MCFFNSSTIECQHPECHQLLIDSIVRLSPTTHDLLSASTLETSRSLQQLVQNNLKIQGLISRCERSFGHAEAGGGGARHHEVPSHLIYDLVRQPETHLFLQRLELTSDFPEVLVRDTGFNLRLCVVKRDGRPATGLKGLRFRAMLFTSGSDMCPVKFSIQGKRALKGSVESTCSDTAEVVFPHLVANEVSSHYMDNSLSLAVVCLSSSFVQPFVRGNITIKQRRPRNERILPNNFP